MDNPLTYLRQFIAEHYDLENLRTLCFDLGVDYDELGGEGKTARARELLLYLGRQRQFDKLLDTLHRTRRALFDQAGLSTDPAALYAALPTFEAVDLQAEIAQLRQMLASLAQLGLPTTEVEERLAAREARVAGLGAIAQDHSVAAGAGGVAVGRDVYGDVIVAADPDQLLRLIGTRRPFEDLRQATKRYLTYVVDRYRYLDLKGMGVSDRVPLRLPLAEVYVPLEARVELPEGETWSRGLRLAGRVIPDEEGAALGERLSAPQPVLDLLRRSSGLIVLGDPGAGKTTFLKYLVLGLATGQGEQLNLGVHLPVLVPLSAYANALAQQDVRLDDFIAGYFHNLGTDLPIATMLREALKEGGVLVLLDGLDEVQDPALRETVVERVADFYTFHRRAGNKFVLTSRIVGYRGVRPAVEGLAECTLVDFDDEGIETFVAQWTGAIERAAHGNTPVAAQETVRERQELLEAIQNNPGVRRLAANPLLLTILALMKRQGVTLPERRVELYDQYVRTLLSSWNRARGLGRPPTRDLDVVETVRVLAPLALWMHQVNPGVGLVKGGDLRRKLVEIYRQRGEDDPERASRRFLADVREYASLLLERGAGQYGFIHLTFEEYLAAVGIARLGQLEIERMLELLAEHVGDPAWREVALLTICYLGIVQQQERVAGQVVGALLEQEPGEPGQAIVLSGQAVADAWPGGVTRACKEHVVGALVRTLGDDERVAALLRAEAGDTLARLGDPRPGVGLHPDGLPDITWCEVPAGPFLMGSSDTDEMAVDWERPQHEVTLPAFKIGKYPVTNAQFRAFVDAGGYAERRYWTKDGWRRRERGDRTEPREFGTPFDSLNHPVVGFSWYEAVAFCHWLTGVWRAEGKIADDEVVRLPTEEEWEKAARGTDGRRYPWGDDPDPNRANYGDTHIGSTSAVGCFPGGASPYGCQDMSGNVWEWTSSLYQDYPYRADDGRGDPTSLARRVLRGGSFDYDERLARCADRFDLNPSIRYRSIGFRVAAAPFSLSPSAL